jgi:hypothetical protein
MISMTNKIRIIITRGGRGERGGGEERVNIRFPMNAICDK